MQLSIINPHGFCTGVARAIDLVEKVLAQHPGETLYCLHEIVHNEHVVSRLTALGMIVINHLTEAPIGARVLFSAHGVSPAIRQEAQARQLEVIDATCPFVDKVHREVLRFKDAQQTILCIGHKGHDEVEGVIGEAPDCTTVIESPKDVDSLTYPADHPIAVVSQTTISATMYDSIMVALKGRFSQIQAPNHTDICYATRDRQSAVTDAAQIADHILVLGSTNSSNSRRLVETAQSAGCSATLIATLDELHNLDLTAVNHLAITSGASTPETFLQKVVAILTKAGCSISDTSTQ